MNKFQPITSSRIFIIYSSQYKGYRCLHVFLSCQFVFNESNFPFTSSSKQQKATSTTISSISMHSHSYHSSDIDTNLINIDGSVSPISLCRTTYSPDKNTFF